MKDYRYITMKVLTVVFLLTSSISISGCSFVGSIFGGAYDVVMWGPRKLWSVTGAPVFDVKNEQQTDVGPRRKPTGNPTGGRAALQDYQMPPMQPNNSGGGAGFAPALQGNGAMPGYPPMPQANSGALQGLPPMPQGGYNPPQMPQAGGYPYPPQQGSLNLNQSGGMAPLSQGRMPTNQAGDMGQAPAMPYPPASPYPSDGLPAGANGMPPMPPMPSANQMQQGGGLPSMNGAPLRNPGMGGSGPMDPDGMDADAAYAGGGGGSQKKGFFSWLPFLSSKYKMERIYEPLSAEFTIAAKDFPDAETLSSSINVEPLGVQGRHRVSDVQNSNRITKTSRAASMFPLQDYAPKPTVIAQKMDNNKETYPKLGDIPSAVKTPVEGDDAQSAMEKIMKESAAANAKQAAIHGADNAQENAPKNSENNRYKLSNQSDKATKAVSPRYGTLGTETLKNDAEVLKDVPKDTTQPTAPAAEEEQKRGFFSRLFHPSSAKPAPKMIWRKSEPPVPSKRADNIGLEAIESSRPLPHVDPEADEDIEAMKKFQPASGSLLPKPRYNDRRKVPQVD